ncbi:MAG: hypothetical protein JXR95_09560 [Deltaproteobacteria bacterium]|nr:hypothetical protein [Deltaproteobacteria bacterium]
MFESSDFEVFSRAKWSDMVYNRDRLKVKEKLVALGKQISDMLNSELDDFVSEVGTEHPALWNKRAVDRLEFFFLRPESQRKILSKAFSGEIPMAVAVQNPSDLYTNCSIGLVIDNDGLKVGLRLPSLAMGDREVLKINLREDSRYSQFEKVLDSLEEQIVCVIDGTVLDYEASNRRTSLSNALDRLYENAVKDYRSFLGLIRIFTREECIEYGDGIVEHISEVFKVLIPVYKMIAWNINDDFAGISGLVSQIEKSRQQEKEKSQKQFEEIKKVQEVKVSHTVPEAAVKKPAEHRKSQENSRPPVKKPKKHKNKPESRKNDRKIPDKKINAGDKVIVESGLLSGKEGIVLSVNGFNCKVQVGNIQTNIDSKFLKIK